MSNGERNCRNINKFLHVSKYIYSSPGWITWFTRNKRLREKKYIVYPHISLSRYTGTLLPVPGSLNRRMLNDPPFLYDPVLRSSVTQHDQVLLSPRPWTNRHHQTLATFPKNPDTPQTTVPSSRYHDFQFRLVSCLWNMLGNFWKIAKGIQSPDNRITSFFQFVPPTWNDVKNDCHGKGKVTEFLWFVIRVWWRFEMVFSMFVLLSLK